MTAALEKHRAILAGKEEAFFTEHAAENETEFFADASEAFFCRPHDLQVEEPGVYDLLTAYYRVDPRKWFSNSATGT
jgi:Mlc titration factor MtfA (ptsG expression regulator)